ncbi:uncharacterized protein LOC135698873 [Ochlerotatus camptorhynchus]|uniref:uncharacterized protein LOC135698873 n=1 Tax=Ochlerotatus camptorhynchus TaxID=644619 RepID=UPI0031D5678F
MATKAVHLELVGDLSSEAFIAALKRFVARRGKPIALFCDHATNFKGTDRELRDLCKQLNDQQLRLKVASFCAESSIQFNFIPANAPTFGGLWEAAVKAFKHHFRTPINPGARPCPSSQHPVSLGQEMQRRTQTFWKLWSTDYLHQLQQRTKHYYRQPNVLIGKLVLLKDDNLPPFRWSMGRIENVHPGADGLVRVVTVRLASDAIFDRSIVKICLLPTDSEDSSASTSGEVPGSPDGNAATAAIPEESS